jgi:hypothetical protein
MSSVLFEAFKHNDIICAHIKGHNESSELKNFHLVLLIDKSGSMEGIRMVEVKNTLVQLVNKLKENDKISLITYNDIGSILINSMKAEGNRNTMINIINGINANNGTNLEGGLMKISELTDQSIDGVFILTDGMINIGTTSSAGLQTIAQSVIPSGVPLSTVGYGPDHNQILLRDLALYSKGSYTYADSDEMIPAIVGDICAGLATEVGKNGKINIPNNYSVFEIGSTIVNFSGSTNDGSDFFKIGSVIDNKSQYVVFKYIGVGVSPNNLTLIYNENNGTERTLNTIVHEYTTDEEGIIVNEQYNRADVSITLYEATNLIKSGQINDAKAELNNLINRLNSSISNNRSLVISLKAQVIDMLTNIPEPQTFSHDGMFATRAGGTTIGNVMCRLTSATACVSNQRGILSMSTTYDEVESPTLRGDAGAGSDVISLSLPSRHPGVHNNRTISLFSSPAQVAETSRFVSSVHNNPTEIEENDEMDEID